MFSKLFTSLVLFAALQGVNGEPEALKANDNLNRRGFSQVVSYSVDWQHSIYIPPASGGVSYSASAIPSFSAGNSYSNWHSYSQSSGPSYSQSSQPSYSASVSSMPAGQSSPQSQSRGPNSNSPQNSQSVGAVMPSSSGSPSPSPAPGAASTFSNLGCTVTMLLAALTGVVAFIL